MGSLTLEATGASSNDLEDWRTDRFPRLLWLEQEKVSLIPFREIETWSTFHRVSDRHFLSAGNGWAQAACYVALGLGGILA